MQPRPARPGLRAVGMPRGPLGWAGLLVGAQGAALLLLGIGYAVSGVVGRPEDRLATVLAGALAVVVGLALLPVARALALARGWAVAPTLVTQVLLVVVGWGLWQGRVYRVAVPMVLVAAGVLYLLARPEARAALQPPDTGPPA